MRYPTTGQYIESISNPDSLFATLRRVAYRPDAEGEPIYCSGSYGTVFAIEIDGKPHALKCFTRHQPGRAEAYRRIAQALLGAGSTYVVPPRWLDRELVVFDDLGTPAEHSVLLMEWVEGCSLANTLETADAQEYERLSGEFDRLALWLLEQPFAHGDLKPDNLMVRRDGGLVLIDYDGLYLPDMEGERARENGTEGFRHPRRDPGAFGAWVDDYSIALISLSLRALARWPELYERFHEAGYLLLRPEAIMADRCPAYTFLRGTELAHDPLFGVLARPTDGPIRGLCQMLRGEYDGGGKIQPLAATLKHKVADYDECGEFAEGLAPVRRGQKWGYIDEFGELAIGLRYDDAWPIREGRGLVKYRGKYGFIGARERRMAIPARYEFAQNFREGTACVMQEGLYGYIDRRGKFLVRPIFDYARPKRDGQVYVELGDQGRTIEL